MAGTKISALAALTALADGDLLPIVDVSDPGSGTTKKVTAENVATYVIDATAIPVISGLVEGGVVDNGSAINAALTALSAAGGGARSLPAGNYAFAGEIVVPEFVDLVGAGSGWAGSATNHMTRLVATNAAAKITFESSGGTSGNFMVDGDEIATGPLFHRKIGAERCFQSIIVTGSLGEGIRIDEAQNETWLSVKSWAHDGPTLVLDNGCAGNVFLGCEFAGTNDWHIVITETTGTGPYGALGPGHNTFEHCLIEYAKGAPGSTFEGCVDAHSGIRNVFRDCVFSGSGYEMATSIIRIDDDAPIAPTGGVGLTFDGCWFATSSTGPEIGIIQNAGTVRLYGDTLMIGLTSAWQYNAGSAYIYDDITYNAVTNRWDPAGTGTVSNITNLVTRPVNIRTEAADAFGLRIAQHGDTATRFDITNIGALGWGTGAAGIDTVLYRISSGLLGMLTGDSFQVDGIWNGGMFRLGAYRFWMDAKGVLRVKNGAPASDLDGTVVGAQNDSFFLDERDFVTQGAAAAAFIGQQRGFLFDAATSEFITAPMVFPSSWLTATIDLHWTNAGAGAGDVVWGITADSVIAGGSVATIGTTINFPAATAPAQNILSITAGPSALTLVAGAQYSFDVFRFATDAGDTLANDAGLVGVTLRQAS